MWWTLVRWQRPHSAPARVPIIPPSTSPSQNSGAFVPTSSLLGSLLNVWSHRVIVVVMMTRACIDVGSGGSGLVVEGAGNWNAQHCGPGGLGLGITHVCTVAISREGPCCGWHTARSPYINRHMFSSRNKMYSLLCFPWTPIANKLDWLPVSAQRFNPSRANGLVNKACPICLSLCLFLLLITHSIPSWWPSLHPCCPVCVNGLFKGRNVLSFPCLSAPRL